MRPLKLTMSAFGPYANKEIIDMEKLGETGLYLITGDTGSGKTTIFDAICYALYGVASGDVRENSMLRSTYAAAETPTMVELIFRHRDKTYTVTRNPDYTRPKGRGTGETTEKANAILKKSDGQIVEGLKKVNEEIYKVLGVTREQFTQIAMLAQGQFLDLLLAGTKERQVIFGQLFHTEKYGKLQEVLKKESSELKKSYETAIAGLKQHMAGVSCAENDELSDEVDKAKAGETTTEDVEELICRLIDRDSTKQKDTDDAVKKIEDKIAAVNADIGRYRTIENARRNLAKATDEREKLIPVKNAADEEFVRIQQNLAKREELQRQIAAIEAELPNYDKLEQLKRTLLAAGKQLDENTASAGRKIESRDKADAEMKKNREELESLKNAGEKKEQLKAEIDRLDVRLKTIAGLRNDLSEIDKKKSELERAQKIYIKDEEECSAKKDVFDEMDRAYRKGQAGILAQGLVDGRECPVCGSKEHPFPAKVSKDFPTKEKVDVANEAYEKARKKASSSSEKANSINSVIGELESKLKKASEAICSVDDITALPGELDERTNETKEKKAILSEQLKAENDRIRRREELEKQIPDIEKQLNDIKLDLEKIGQESSQIKGKQQADEKQRAELAEALTFPEKNSALLRQRELKYESENIQKTYEKAEKEKNRIAEELKSIEGQIEGYKKTADSENDFNIDELTAEKEKLESEKNKLADEQKELHARITANKKVQDNLSKKSGELAKLENKYSWVSILANTVDGNLSGKEKVQLETYVQMAYFERIINRANIRFLQMSDGQYELERQGTADSKARQSGLDLVVVDHYNGTRRSVKSLSGGESFMASLSLALGLSEEVQASAGGIQIDTMFVDEGFGSLDTEKTLPQAYSALAGLSNGNKLVGIISHVSELKERIDKQIVVKKDKSGGSTTKLLV